MLVNQYLLHVLGLIEKHGWAVQSVLGGDLPSDPPFSYTVGLTALGHPELILIGMPSQYAQRILNSLGEEVRKGHTYLANTTTADATDPSAPVALIEVGDPSMLLVAVELYQQVDALQVIWPDPKGRLPWDDGYPNPAWAQPFLGAIPEKFDV
jgi:hypothetical protein